MKHSFLLTLISFGLGAVCSAQTANTPFPIGLYVSNPNGNDPTAEKNFENSYDAFVKNQGGAHPTFFNAFTDFGQDPSQWPSNASWSAWSCNLSGANYVGSASGAIPVVGVPMASNAGGWGNVDQFYQDTIAGVYDAAYKGIVDAWADNGYKTVEFRNGYEFDGNFMPWAPGNSSSASAVADFVKAFQHIADIEHSEGAARGITVKVEWNPAAINWTGYDLQTAYPGDQYVDVISVDTYSPVYPNDLTDWAHGGTSQAPDLQTWAADPANRAHFWQYQNANQYNPTPGLGGSGWSVQNTIDFARQHGKPIAIDESGAGPTSNSPYSPSDDPAFPQWLHNALAAAQSQGLTVDHVDIWDATLGDGDWNFTNGSKPNEAAAWAQYFGAQSGVISPSTWYNVVNSNSGSCMDDSAWGTTNGTPVIQWNCNQQQNQQWQFQPTDSGYYKIVNRNASSEVVSVKDSGTINGSLVHIWQYYSGNTSQQWMPVALGNRYYKFVGRGSSLCLDVPGASTVDGVQLQIWSCNGTGAQSFRLVAQP